MSIGSSVSQTGNFSRHNNNNNNNKSEGLVTNTSELLLQEKVNSLERELARADEIISLLKNKN